VQIRNALRRSASVCNSYAYMERTNVTYVARINETESVTYVGRMLYVDVALCLAMAGRLCDNIRQREFGRIRRGDPC
jgi:hypothetical protein